jgi:hypothetical protein
MSSNAPSDPGPVDFGRDVPTTEEDVRVLRLLRRQARSWLELSVEELEALIPPGACERRSATPPGRRPFTLE